MTSLNKLVNKAIKHDTKHHINDEINKKGFWNGISNFVQLNSSKKEDPITLDRETVETLNNFYAEIGVPLRDTTLEENLIMEAMDKWIPLFRPHSINANHLKETWKLMKNKKKKTEDITGLSLLMLSLLLCIPNVEESIVTLFNQFIESCQMPIILKTSIITP